MLDVLAQLALGHFSILARRVGIGPSTPCPADQTKQKTQRIPAEMLSNPSAPPTRPDPKTTCGSLTPRSAGHKPDREEGWPSEGRGSWRPPPRTPGVATPPAHSILPAPPWRRA